VTHVISLTHNNNNSNNNIQTNTVALARALHPDTDDGASCDVRDNATDIVLTCVTTQL